jgi:hypothetical protein
MARPQLRSYALVQEGCAWAAEQALGAGRVLDPAQARHNLEVLLHQQGYAALGVRLLAILRPAAWQEPRLPRCKRSFVSRSLNTSA